MPYDRAYRVIFGLSERETPSFYSPTPSTSEKTILIQPVFKWILSFRAWTGRLISVFRSPLLMKGFVRNRPFSVLQETRVKFTRSTCVGSRRTVAGTGRRERGEEGERGGS